MRHVAASQRGGRVPTEPRDLRRMARDHAEPASPATTRGKESRCHTDRGVASNNPVLPSLFLG